MFRKWTLCVRIEHAFFYPVQTGEYNLIIIKYIEIFRIGVKLAIISIEAIGRIWAKNKEIEYNHEKENPETSCKREWLCTCHCHYFIMHDASFSHAFSDKTFRTIPDY